MHAAKVLNAIKNKDKTAEFRGIGGDASAVQGLQLLYHQKEIAFMGFIEVFKHLRTILRVMQHVKSDIKAYKPDSILLVDYPGFNLKIAKYAKSLSIPVHYYIAPKVWAWKEKRIKKINKFVNKLYSILPFEESYFSKAGIDCKYVGNPSKIAVNAFIPQTDFKEVKQINKPLIALLPGSRNQEISKNLSIMLELRKAYPDYCFAIAQAPGFTDDYYKQFGSDLILTKDMYNLLHYSKAAVVTSGTATLETALHKVPQVVCYKTSATTYRLAKWFIKINFISLVNIIVNREVIKELIQEDFNYSDLKLELDKILTNSGQKRLELDYAELDRLLGNTDPALLVAESIVSYKA